MPLRAERHLADIVNCTGKTGDATFKVIEQQCATKGALMVECVCGVGDGGGENEGVHGVHAICEALNSSYVRRRCFGHLPWRVADAGIESPGEDSGDGVGVGEAAGDFRRAGLLRASCPGELSFSWEPVEGALAGAPCWRCENETDTAAGALEGVAEALEGDALDESAGAAGTSGANAELARAVLLAARRRLTAEKPTPP